MLFSELATYLQKLEETSSRNEIVEILAQLLKRLSNEEIDKTVYLLLGKLGPSYDTEEINIAEKTVINIIGRVVSIDKEKILNSFKKTGDWGSLLQQYKKPSESKLDINAVFEALVRIAHYHGQGSHEYKIRSSQELILQLDPLSSKYVIRIILKKLRLGFSEMTILDALSWMISNNKENRGEIEKAYNLVADIGKIAKILKRSGILGVNSIKIEVGIPILLSAAERLPSPVEIAKRIPHGYLEPKIDGFRLQVHVDKSRKTALNEGELFSEQKTFVRFFSRNLEDMTSMVPELEKAVVSVTSDSFIIEGEAVVFDCKNKKYYPFQQTISRKRKYGISEKATEIPLTLFAFDLLYKDGVSYITKPYSERRKALEKMISSNNGNIQTIEQKVFTSANEIREYFNTKKKEGFEGIMVKMSEAPYEAGSRGFHWIKYKREEEQKVLDSIDVVVLGYYYGEGKRTDFGIGALLVGVYNEDKERFESIAKIGTGITDELFYIIKKDCDKLKINKQCSNVVVPKELIPHIWIEPRIVAVVLADEITKSPIHTAGIEDGRKGGFALRFPRLVQWDRKDKSPSQVTTVEEIKSLFNKQL